MPLGARRLLAALGAARLGRGVVVVVDVGRTQAHRESVALASLEEFGAQPGKI